jgi:divalent metal cation (Fe/Co/Zn/Cd) transporter
MHALDGPEDSGSVSHGHSHGAVDEEILGSARGIWATKISLAALLATAVLQLVIYAFTDSVALLADSIVGLVISVAILRIVVETSKSVFARLLDGVEPEVPDEVRSLATATPGVEEVAEVRVRWLGHKMLAEVNIAVDPGLSVAAGHDIAEEVHHELLHNLKYLSNATVHVDPVGLAGEEHHRHGFGNVEHEDEPSHTGPQGRDLEDEHEHENGHSHHD